MRQCQLVQLHLLHVFDRICRENGLNYVLEGGTLLGAMRHDGFIPWDDDLDVGMPRLDYEKFVRIARTVLPIDVELVLPTDIPKTPIPFAKLRDVYSFYCECSPNIATSDPSGIYIDIFPYDNLPGIGKTPARMLMKIGATAWWRSIWFLNRGFLLMSLVLKLVHKSVVLAVKLLNKLFPGEYCTACFENAYPFAYKKADLFPSAKHRFEDGEFNIPGEPDAILTGHYGDWRKLPPESERSRHARIIDAFHSASGREYPMAQRTMVSL